MLKTLPANSGEEKMWIRSLGKEYLLEELMQSIPVFFPGKSYGQKSLMGYSPGVHKDSDMTEHTCMVLGSILVSFFYI